MSDSERIPKYKRKSQIQAVNKYAREHYDRIAVQVPIGDKERYKKEARDRGYDSLNAFIIACIEKVISADSSVDDSE